MTKQEILEKIEPLFFQKSFKEISLQEIADTLKMKKASLYYHFPSKESLIEEIIEKSFQDYLFFIKIVLKKTQGNYDQLSICEMIERIIEFPEKNKNIFGIIMQNGFTENEKIEKNILEKQKNIFQLFFDYTKEEFDFSSEKSYILLETMKDFSRKIKYFGDYNFNLQKISHEIYDIFFYERYF